MLELAYIAKWLHLCLVMVLIGGLIGNAALLIVIGRCDEVIERQALMRLSRLLDWAQLVSIVLLAVTGTVLVYPRGYTFATPWIDAAYVFLALAAFGVGLSIYLKRRICMLGLVQKSLVFAYGLVVLLVLVTLIIIAYEAVIKQTFLF